MSVLAIGENIKKARKAAGLTQKQLSEKIGKGLSTVQKYELGIFEPSVSIIGEIATALGVDAYYLHYGYTCEEWMSNALKGKKSDSLMDGKITVYEPVREDEKTFTIEVSLDDESMSADELTMALKVIFESARENNISVVALSELAAAAAAAISEKRNKQKDSDAQ